MTNSNDDELYYKGEKINIGISTNVTQEYLKDILSSTNIDKYINNEDLLRLSKYLPSITHLSKEHLKNILTTNPNTETAVYKPPMEIFRTMLSRNYFTHNYQCHLDRLKIEGIEEYINIYEKTLNHIEKSKDKYSSQLLARDNDNLSVTEIAQREYILNFDENEVVFESNSYLASSGYTTLNSDDENESEETEIYKENTMDIECKKPIELEAGLEGSLSEERFRNLKMNKNQLTIRPRSKEELKEFQGQELERYKFPHLPWPYTNADASVSVVSPVQKKIPSGTVAKPRDHVMLKSDRPAYVTILCLVRDAASRLPEGVGTRADICDLLKDSQYINERLSDAQINNIVSGALDRLHYEKDPCVKYDLTKKLWIYLHKNRTTDYQPWNDHLVSKDPKQEKTDLSLNCDDKLDEKDPHVLSVVVPKNSSGKKNKKEKLLKSKRKSSK